MTGTLQATVPLKPLFPVPVRRRVVVLGYGRSTPRNTALQWWAGFSKGWITRPGLGGGGGSVVSRGELNVIVRNGVRCWNCVLAVAPSVACPPVKRASPDQFAK